VTPRTSGTMRAGAAEYLNSLTARGWIFMTGTTGISVPALLWLVLSVSALFVATRVDAADGPSESRPKVTYPQSREAFMKGFKEGSRLLVCRVKEYRKCLGFSDECITELDAAADVCATEGGVVVPASIASSEDAKALYQSLFKCITKRQFISGRSEISIAACMKVDELRRRSSSPTKRD
jgi:hypothetical protein